MAKYFLRNEIACKCQCGFDAMDEELMTVLDDLRYHFHAAVQVTSGNRCHLHNKEIGGHKHSYHLRGRAADIRVDGVQPWEVQRYLRCKYPEKYGIGMAQTFTHIDTRSGRARWEYKS